MLVSVVIPSRNRARALDRALLALAVQTPSAPRWEVIVVSDASSDGTEAVCQRWQARLPQLRYLRLPQRRGSAGACNAGIGMARGEQIILTDDDCVPAPDWVERMSAALTHHPIVAGAVDSPRDDFFKLCFNLSTFHRFFPRRSGGPTLFLAGANYGFRREVLEELGRLDVSQRIASDMDLALRAQARGYRIYFEPGAVVVHDHDRTCLTDVLRYAAIHATWTIDLRRRHAQVLGTPLLLRSAPLLLVASPAVALGVTLAVFARNPRLWRCAHTAPVVYASKLAWCLGASAGLARLPTGAERSAA